MWSENWQTWFGTATCFVARKKCGVRKWHREFSTFSPPAQARCNGKTARFSRVMCIRRHGAYMTVAQTLTWSHGTSTAAWRSWWWKSYFCWAENPNSLNCESVKQPRSRISLLDHHIQLAAWTLVKHKRLNSFTTHV